MKTLSKRILALATAFVMVLSMLSVGTLSVFAEVDTSGTVIEIGSVADWNEVAAQGLDFSGKTVKLTADINKNGTAVDLTTLSSTFKGTFDGNGYTIYNVKATKALIAKNANGATVQNVNISNIVLTSEANSGALIATATDTNVTNVSVTGLTLSASATSGKLGGVIGSLIVNASKNISISNIKVDAVLSYTGTGTNGAYGTFDGSKDATGGVIGYASIGDGATLTIQSCLAEGSINSNESVGAILGYGEPGAFNNTTNILNCESKMTLSNGPANNLVANRAGMGMIGLWHNGGSAGQLWKGTLNVTNCVNGGSMTSTIGTNDNNKKFSTPGGMLGAVSPWRDNCGDGATINIKNCLLTGAVTTAGTTKGAMIGAARNFMNCAFNIENCATTQEDYNTAFGFAYSCTGTTLTVDGEAITFTSNAAPLLVLTAKQAESLITRDADGYIVSVGKTLIAGYQTSTATRDKSDSDNTQVFDLRIVALLNGSYKDCQNVGFEVTATYGTTESKTTTQTVNTLYNSISAVNNGSSAEYTAETLGGDYIYVLACKNLPAGVEITFNVTTFYTRTDGTRVNGETATFTVNEVPSNNMPELAG